MTGERAKHLPDIPIAISDVASHKLVADKEINGPIGGKASAGGAAYISVAINIHLDLIIAMVIVARNEGH